MDGMLAFVLCPHGECRYSEGFPDLRPAAPGPGAAPRRGGKGLAPPPAENLTVLRHARRQTVSGQSVSHGFELEGSATRPVIRGRPLGGACGHYPAALAGMRMRDRGGNAIDAGVAMAFAQAVLEFQSYGFGGECPILIYGAETRGVVATNGNTRAPAAATIQWFRDHGITLIPGDGFLPAGVPAAPDALITALDRYGRLALKDVLAPAIELAAHGFPVYEGMRDRIAATADRFRSEWPTSAALFLPAARVPARGETWRPPPRAQRRPPRGARPLLQGRHRPRDRGLPARHKGARRERDGVERSAHRRRLRGVRDPRGSPGNAELPRVRCLQVRPVEPGAGLPAAAGAAGGIRPGRIAP